MCRTRKPPCTSRIAASSSPTRSTRCARCATAVSSTRRATWRGWRARSASCRSPSRCATAALAHVMRQVIRRNHVRNGLVYLQVTRGAAPREFYFPDAERDADRRLPGPLSLAGAGRRQCGDRHCRQVDARHPLAALRHQDGDAAAGLPCQGGGAQGRRARGLVRRPGRLRHRGRLEQRLDRRRNPVLSSPGHWAPIFCPA